MLDNSEITTEQTSPPHFVTEDVPLRFGDLVRSALEQQSDIQVTGTSSQLALAGFLSRQSYQGFNSLPHVVVLGSEQHCQHFASDLSFFNPEVRVHQLPTFDVSPYSSLYPSPRITCERLAWLHAAQNAKEGEIFLASVGGVLQTTLPFESLARNTKEFALGDELPSELGLYLESLGYTATPLVEDVGSFAVRGGVVDIFSPAHEHPIRLELFGDLIDSIREFDPETQRSLGNKNSFTVIPCREVIYNESDDQKLILSYRKTVAECDPNDVNEISHSLSRHNYFHGVDFLLPHFYSQLSLPLEHFSTPVNLWLVNPLELARAHDSSLSAIKEEYESSTGYAIRPDYKSLYHPYEKLQPPEDSKTISLSKIQLDDHPSLEEDVGPVEYRSFSLDEFSARTAALRTNSAELVKYVHQKLNDWKQNNYVIIVAGRNVSQSQRIKILLEKADFEPVLADENDYLWQQWHDDQLRHPKRIHIIPRQLTESLRFSEHMVLLRDEDFFGRKQPHKTYKNKGTLDKRTHALSFGDLKAGDLIVHTLHGVAVYEGLKVMPINGYESEFLQLKYKDGDKLYLPVYRINQIHRYSGPSSTRLLDKLGGPGWEKAKTKVKKRLRDVAADLLKFYAERSQVQRPEFKWSEEDYLSFETAFPHEETDDQLKAIHDVVGDLHSEKPMDRLICGDVGFGKTEVAMRAAFVAALSGKQVAVIAPTTILTFQHYKNFKKRFKNWPVTIRSLNRFVPRANVREIVSEMKDGKIDIVIGTHRLLSKDIDFKNLGLLIIDEEQKFGVKHKERIRRLKTSVDTLAMSATPIPRTLNMSLMGLRDLSIINTPPVDRLPTRTFVCRFERETIRKAIDSELSRGGQVFFIHNRIQTIYNLANEIREIVPHARIKVAHGQMEEGDLEKTMVEFFNHNVDILICTTIIESGMDIPRANTMFIDNAHQFGLSQLYQLRGRVGRSKDRAYCYLLVPQNRKIDKDAQERLRVIQENTALGSGIRIAQHDLELRGAGDLLGEDQSGHINAVGYELYMELLEDAIRHEKGEPDTESSIDPEINIRVPALIPSEYIPDIRIRLSYYKALSQIESADDLDSIEDELRDQFGKPPEAVLNLMGLMLIRKTCKDLGIKDISSSKSFISLSFTETTPLPPNKVVELSLRENKKYAITPDNRLNIRMNEILWPRVYDELMYLQSLCPSSKA